MDSATANPTRYILRYLMNEINRIQEDEKTKERQEELQNAQNNLCDEVQMDISALFLLDYRSAEGYC